MKSQPSASMADLCVSGSRAVLLIVAAALYPSVSLKTLTPSFGAIPSAIYHDTTVFGAAALALLLSYVVELRTDQTSRTLRFVSILASFMPIIQWISSSLNQQLGIPVGPIAMGFVSCHMLLVSSILATMAALDDLLIILKLSPLSRVAVKLSLISIFTPTVQSLVYNAVTVFCSSSQLPAVTPLVLQHVLAFQFMTFLPISWSALVIAILLPSAITLNPRMSVRSLNGSLRHHGWSLVDRRWSNTGYLSILENHNEQYCVMRCDHSLLGGEWILTPARRKQGWTGNEPTYCVFEMLEAVRLLKLDPPIPDSTAQALVIGLGIGTAPKALLAHGINTTIVELDPVVHHFATQYFALPPNHTAIITDAVTWLTTPPTTSAPAPPRYDYILHDVFTGGAEPLPLFTTTFLAALRARLTPRGVAAINYAGDLTLPLTRVVLRTVLRAFDGQCRVFRDNPPSSSPDLDGTNMPVDFLNMVIFCRNSAGPIAFRAPTERDLLGSRSRAHFLLPRNELEVRFEEVLGDVEKGEVLRVGDEGKWRAQQVESASRHWRIMRDVVPDAVWELW